MGRDLQDRLLAGTTGTTGSNSAGPCSVRYTTSQYSGRRSCVTNPGRIFPVSSLFAMHRPGVYLLNLTILWNRYDCFPILFPVFCDLAASAGRCPRSSASRVGGFAVEIYSPWNHGYDWARSLAPAIIHGRPAGRNVVGKSRIVRGGIIKRSSNSFPIADGLWALPVTELE